MNLKDYAEQQPDNYDRIVEMVRAEISIDIEDFGILKEQGLSDLYIKVKALHENLKLARLTELILGKKGKEQIVLVEEFGTSSELLSLAYLQGGRR